MRRQKSQTNHRKKRILWILVLLAAAVVIVGAVYISRAPGHQMEAESAAESGAKKEAGAGKKKSPEKKKSEPETVNYDVTLGFAGDINFADDHETTRHYEAIGGTKISDVIDPEYVSLMNGMSLMWINNEFAYSKQGAPLPGKAYTFRSDPSHVEWLKELGIDIAGLANNHVNDYGQAAMTDTFQTLEDAGIPYVGAGRNLERAKSPVYLQADGLTIAYVAASSAEYTKYTPQATDTTPGILECYDNTLFLEAIREARANADYVIALPHWGTEYSTQLTSIQTEGAKAYIDAGADIVIGAHPHILQGISYYKGKPIVYSLGNFWFNDKTLNTMIAEVEIRGSYQKPADASASSSSTDPETEGQAAATSSGRPDISTASVTLRLIPGVQTGCETHMAKTPEEKHSILQSIQSISTNAVIGDDGVVTEASSGE